jgi:Domain of unknown function (DUF4440)
MRRLITLSCALLLAVPLLMGAPGDKAADNSQSVVNLENAWNQAEARHDAKALKLLLAETFVYTDYDGSVAERDEWLKKVQSEAKDYRNLATVEQTARSYGGDTVVVNGIYVEKLIIKGRNVDRRVRFTDTWILQNSYWKCVASQSTLMAGS